MTTWVLDSGWEVTSKNVWLTKLGDKGYILKKDNSVSLVEHRPGALKGREGHWRYFRDYEQAAVFTAEGIFFSPRGKGEKTLNLEKALEGVGMKKEERIQLMKLIYGAN